MFFKHALVDGGKKLVVFCDIWVVEYPDVGPMSRFSTS